MTIEPKDQQNALYEFVGLLTDWNELITLYNQLPLSEMLEMSERVPGWGERYEDALDTLKKLIDEVYTEYEKSEIELWIAMGWDIEKLKKDRKFAEGFADAVIKGYCKAVELGLTCDNEDDNNEV